MSRTIRTSSILACFMAGAAILSGCMTATPYQAAPLDGHPPGDGYHETRLEPDRWRVVFHGNSLTSRETVETYLLYRAAELTRDQGYDWFVAVTRDTEARTQLLARGPSDPWDHSWSPRWRIADRAGWRTWEPEQDRLVVVSAITAYEAIAEIRMGRGPRPGAGPEVYDARDVLATLEARIVRPE